MKIGQILALWRGLRLALGIAMSRFLAWALPAFCVASLVGACGGKSFGPDSGDEGGSGGASQAGTGSGADDSGGTGIAGSGVAGSGHGGTSGVAGTGSGGKASCSPQLYEDEGGGNVPVRIINGTMKPIYLGEETAGCAGAPLFQVHDGRGGALASVPYCQSTCSSLLSGVAIGCPAIACAISSVTLAPGESTMTLWNALYSETVTLPPACVAKVGQKECPRVVSVKPGTYIFTAQAGSAMQCLNNDTGGCGGCMPSSSGGCTTYGAVISGPILNAKVDVQLDGSYGIGGPGGGGMVRSVDITFE
jgi:hypothetical protein